MNILLLTAKKVRVFHDPNPANIDWSSEGVEIVVEATGRFRKRDDAAQHLGGSVKKVIISAPAKRRRHYYCNGC